ncbi:MAG TPA: type VI secretion IcmF C-terminal domain-containing protein, partial [Pyrinomonadaceae bacterium]
SKEDWVVATTGDGSQAQSTDVSKLQKMYLDEYTDQWRKFLRSTSIQPFRTKDDAIAALKALSATDSPLERVMFGVAGNTNVSAKPKSSGVWAWIKSWFSSGGAEPGGGDTDIEREFRPLFQFVYSGDKDSSPMSQYRAELRKVLDPLEGASDDQLAQTSKALLTGKDDLGLKRTEQNISNLLEAFKTAAAVDTASLLKQPLNNLRAFLFGRDYELIEKGWNEQIFPRAKAIESGFPFTDGGGESSLSDLGRFLNPVNGQFTVYFNERLSSSFEDTQGEWKLKESGAFVVSDEFVKYLNNARRLREALFPNGGQQPEITYDLTLQPVADTDVLIEIDGTRVETRGTSPQSAKFVWPTRVGSSGAKITVITAGGSPVERPFPGEWGLLKMFAAGSPNQTNENQFSLSWNAGSVPVRATLRPSSANHPFRRNLFTNLRAPKTLQ